MPEHGCSGYYHKQSQEEMDLESPMLTAYINNQLDNFPVLAQNKISPALIQKEGNCVLLSFVWSFS